MSEISAWKEIKECVTWNCSLAPYYSLHT